MRLHGNAALSWQGRRRLAVRVVVEGWTLTAAAEAAGVSVSCARKWVGRYRSEGERGLLDRSSAPRRVANRTAEDRVEVIVKLRRLRFTAAEIAETLRMPLSTVSGILHRLGLGRLGRLGLEQPVRYEHSRPGELVHIDVKRLGRIEGGAGKRVRDGLRQHKRRRAADAAGIRRNLIGWEYVHVCVDDYSRLAYAEVLPNEKAPPRSPSCFERSPSTAATASPSSGYSPTTAAPTVWRARARLRNTRHPPQPHTPLPPADQRQSRTLHPHPDQRLGLRRHLPLKPRTHRRP